MATAVKKTKVTVPAPLPKPDPNVLDHQLHADIELMSKALTKVVEKGSDDIPPDHLGRAVDLLGLVRALVRNTEADYKAKIKDIPDPFAKYTAEKKAITKRAQEVEASLEKGLRGLLEAGWLGADGIETKAGVQLSLVGKRELVLDDPEAIPDDFLLPRSQCLDWGKIKAKIEADEKAVAAAAEAGIALQITDAITAAHLVTNYTFRTKLPDELGS